MLLTPDIVSTLALRRARRKLDVNMSKDPSAAGINRI
jgi:hypothetical protein